MWAVVEIAKKQYLVKKDDVISVQRLKAEGEITFDKVLLVCSLKPKAVKIGTPYVAGAKVTAKIVDEKKAPKVVVYKYKKRKKYRRKTGHRQIHTLLKISDIAKP